MPWTNDRFAGEGPADSRVVVDVAGHGVGRYRDVWAGVHHLGTAVDGSVLDIGAVGLKLFSGCAAVMEHHVVEPLYLRRPDVSVPNPLKHVLATAGVPHHGAAHADGIRTDPDRADATSSTQHRSNPQS